MTTLNIRPLTLLFLLLTLFITACGVQTPATGDAGSAPAVPSSEASAAEMPANDSATGVPLAAEQVLRVGSTTDVTRGIQGRNLIFSTMVTLDTAGQPVANGLAESWEMSEDGMTYTFILRQGVTFHDGTPFNAENAKFALEWLVNHASFGRYVKSVEVVDDNTVRLNLTQPYYPVLLDLGYESNGRILPPTAVDPVGDPTADLVNYIGTGPFRLAERIEDQEATLERFDGYWGEKPTLERIIWKVVPDGATQLVALQSGELDLIGASETHGTVPYVELPTVMQNPDLVVESQSYGRFQLIRFNTTKEPFTDQRVRLAINQAIDRDTMVSSLFGDVTEPATLVLAPIFEYGTSNIEQGYQYDPAAAMELLAEAGWVDSDGDGILDKEGQPFTFELLVPSGEANADMIAPLVQAELKKVGIEMVILNMESTTAYENKSSGNYDAVVHHAGNIPFSPQGLLIQENLTTDGNFKHYSSEELDELILSAFATLDNTERRALYDQIWEILQGEATTIPLYDIRKVVIYNQTVTGFEFAPTLYESGLERVQIVVPQ